MTYLFKHHPLLALAAALLLAPSALYSQSPGAPSAYNAPAATYGGVAAAPPRAIAPTGINADDHILMPGDLIDVKVFQEPDLESTLRIAQDGAIVFPLIGRVMVGGQSPLAAARLIQNLLDKDYLVNPQVTLLVTEYAVRSFTVLGEVQKPGTYDMPDREEVSLLEAIGMSGGYTRVANAGSVTVKRKIRDQETIYHLNAKKMAARGGASGTFDIEPGDVITVSESIF